MSKMSEFFKTKKGVNLIILVSLLGMMLIFLSTIIPKSRAEPVEETSLKDYAENYKLTLETELMTMLAKTSGVGNCKVMLTLSGTEENVFASGKQTEKIIMPSISGAFILCEGGNSPVVKEQVTFAVSSVLNLPTNKIFVSQIAK